VLVPGLTCVACASAMFCVGATPVLVDINQNTLAMDLPSARSLITKNTKVIASVHAFCRLAELESFLDLADEYGLSLIEDCSQVHGAEWKGKKVGTFGSIGCFSMQQSRVLLWSCDNKRRQSLY
jgi:dTDP-4-amino-4,6-dideoxygalactose transaminase